MAASFSSVVKVAGRPARGSSSRLSVSSSLQRASHALTVSRSTSKMSAIWSSEYRRSLNSTAWARILTR